jgi:hypothetical protein
MKKADYAVCLAGREALTAVLRVIKLLILSRGEYVKIGISPVRFTWCVSGSWAIHLFASSPNNLELG